MSSKVYSQGTERFSSTHPRWWGDPAHKPSHCHLFIMGSADARWSPVRALSRFLSPGKHLLRGLIRFPGLLSPRNGTGKSMAAVSGLSRWRSSPCGQPTQRRALLASVGAEQAAGGLALRAAFCPHGAPGAGGEGRQPRAPAATKQTPAPHGPSRGRGGRWGPRELREATAAPPSR